jgi:hypothetical protein
LTNRDEQSHINQYTETPALTGAGANRNQTSEFFANQSSLRTYYGDFLVNFDYDLTDDLSLKANVGSNMQDRRFNITSQGGQNLDIPGWYHINNVLSPSNPSNLDNRLQKSNRASVLANIDLEYKDYLFLNLTGRNDWTSVLSKENNNFFYPSAGYLSYQL